MSLRDGYGPFLLLGVGVLMLGIANRSKPRKFEDRAGEGCDPGDLPPPGYECGQGVDGWELDVESEQFAGYGPYINRPAVDAALSRVGFPDGNLIGFQGYMTMAYGYDIRTDGVVDGPSMDALRQAEDMLNRGEWRFPRGSNSI